MTHSGFVNDRLIISNSQAVLSYMQRQKDLSRYLLWPWRYFHSEKYASWFLRRQLGLRIKELPHICWKAGAFKRSYLR